MTTTAINDVVSIEFKGDIALISVDNPPVNATGLAVREGLVGAVQELGAAKVAALYCSGRTFIAGADIREFGKTPVAPHLPDVCNIIEACEIPIISVIHGTALGGGLEVAMCTHARIGIAGMKVGLPEVLLGLLPGAGGTQRTPRLTGIATALDMITSGRHILGNEALEVGLIDRLVDGDPRDAALAAAQEVLDGTLNTRRTGDLTVAPDQAALDAMATKLQNTVPNLYSPHECVKAVAASTGSLEEGLKYERKLFMDCMQTPQRAGLIHAFFAERAVGNVPEKSETPRDITSIGVIGGGTMGSGIATACLLAGYETTMVEISASALDRGIATVTRNLDGAVKRGKLSAPNRTAVEARFHSATDMSALADIDLVIEAVFEDMDVKKQIFTELETTCKQGAVLASNTSYLDINEIAAATSRPQDVIGLHFFSPAHVMKLLEIVVPDKTAPSVVSSGFALAKRLKKIGVRSGNCDGFIGNRIMNHYRKSVDYMIMDGATPQQVDTALEAFGFAMGPFKVGDLAGLDIGWAARKRRAPTRPAEERYIEISDQICERGWFGRKTGQGYYLYEGRTAHPNPDVAEIIDTERARAGINARTFTDQEIVDRYMAAMVVEAARVVEEGIALRPVDVDAVLLFGYGFPRYRGGPLHYADQIGASELVSRIRGYAGEDAYYWKVPALLQKLADEGTTFADLN